MEKALLVRQAIPFRGLSYPYAAFKGVVPHRFFQKVFHQRIVHLLPHPGEHLLAERKQPLPVDLHKVPLDVQLQDIARPGVIPGDPPDLLLQPHNPVVCPASFQAGIAVADELRLQKPVEIVVEQMMHHPVPERSRQDLAHLGVVDDEARTGAAAVAPGQDLIAQRHQFALAVPLEAHLVLLAAFVPPSVLIGDILVQQQLLRRSGKRERAGHS